MDDQGKEHIRCSQGDNKDICWRNFLWPQHYNSHHQQVGEETDKNWKQLFCRKQIMGIMCSCMKRKVYMTLSKTKDRHNKRLTNEKKVDANRYVLAGDQVDAGGCHVVTVWQVYHWNVVQMQHYSVSGTGVTSFILKGTSEPFNIDTLVWLNKEAHFHFHVKFPISNLYDKSIM